MVLSLSELYNHSFASFRPPKKGENKHRLWFGVSKQLL